MDLKETMRSTKFFEGNERSQNLCKLYRLPSLKWGFSILRSFKYILLFSLFLFGFLEFLGLSTL